MGPIHPPPRTTVTEEYRVPDGMVGLIIGRGGEQINKIQQDSGCKVQISPDSGGLPERSVSLTGSPEAVQKAKALLDDIVSRGRGGPPGPFPDSANGQNGTVQELMIPAGKAGLVIGKGGETIKQLQERAGVKMILIQDGSQNTNVDKPLRIIGEPYKVQQACEMVLDILRERDQGGFGERSDYGARLGGGIDVPVPRHSVGVVIGRSGEMIKKIQNDAGVRIQFKQDDGTGPEKIAHIMGPPERCEHAARIIQDLLQSLRVTGQTGSTGSTGTGELGHWGIIQDLLQSLRVGNWANWEHWEWELGHWGIIQDLLQSLRVGNWANWEHWEHWDWGTGTLGDHPGPAAEPQGNWANWEHWEHWEWGTGTLGDHPGPAAEPQGNWANWEHWEHWDWGTGTLGDHPGPAAEPQGNWANWEHWEHWEWELGHWGIIQDLLQSLRVTGQTGSTGNGNWDTGGSSRTCCRASGELGKLGALGALGMGTGTLGDHPGPAAEPEEWPHRTPRAGAAPGGAGPGAGPGQLGPPRGGNDLLHPHPQVWAGHRQRGGERQGHQPADRGLRGDLAAASPRTGTPISTVRHPGDPPSRSTTPSSSSRRRLRVPCAPWAPGPAPGGPPGPAGPMGPFNPGPFNQGPPGAPPHPGGPPPHQYPPQGLGQHVPQWQPPAPHDPSEAPAPDPNAAWAAYLLALLPAAPRACAHPAPPPPPPPCRGSPPSPPPPARPTTPSLGGVLQETRAAAPAAGGPPPSRITPRPGRSITKNKRPRWHRGVVPGPPPAPSPTTARPGPSITGSKRPTTGRPPGGPGQRPPPAQQGQQAQ
ncbi:far upstream element-binding protein 2-like [Manacus candei]|uniref:far upstream element-binding protein 2-like n=1 Tax=Manacus candei TaxID=415023 RepID=UPI0022264748|nr:far upstream element-binding protein 2-like [Manacus candei]